MRHRLLKLTDYGPAPGAIDAAVEWVLVALLAFMPLALGAVEAWSEFVAVAGALVLALLLVVRRVVRRDVPAEWTWAYLPVALYLLLVLLQLVPLPESLVAKLSPETAAEKSRLLADVPGMTTVAREGVPLKVAAGADVRLDERIVPLLASGEVLTLDGGSYMLLELPHETYIDPAPLIRLLARRGVRSVVTHPERHDTVRRNPDLVGPWL